MYVYNVRLWISQFRVILSTERRKSYYIWAFEVFMYMYVCALSFSILLTYKSMFLWQIRRLLIVLFQQRLRIGVAIGLYLFHCRFNKELGSRPGPRQRHCLVQDMDQPWSNCHRNMCCTTSFSSTLFLYLFFLSLLSLLSLNSGWLF